MHYQFSSSSQEAQEGPFSFSRSTYALGRRPLALLALVLALARRIPATTTTTTTDERNKFFTPSELIYFPHASFHTMIYLPLDICFSRRRWLLEFAGCRVRSKSFSVCVFNPQVRNSCASSGRNAIIGFRPLAGQQRFVRMVACRCNPLGWPLAEVSCFYRVACFWRIISWVAIPIRDELHS